MIFIFLMASEFRRAGYLLKSNLNGTRFFVLDSL
jgi:hypothetical protein